MVEDNTKIQNGTLNCTGTNDTSLEFDARTVGGIYKEFDTLVKTINKYINSSGILGYAYGDKSEKYKYATIIIMLHDVNDIETLKKPVRNLIKAVRSLITAHDVELNLKFETPLTCTDWVKDGETVEWDV
jgi:hypothetical protein